MVTCQVGAETVLKQEVAQRWPDFRFSFSRPGFLTFKLPDDLRLAEDFKLRSIFARSHSFSIGRVQAETDEQRVQKLWETFTDEQGAVRPFDRIHVWQRDTQVPGHDGFEPGISDESRRIHRLLIDSVPEGIELHPAANVPTRPARRGQAVLDCCIVEPDTWWIGTHRTRTFSSCRPGGLMSLTLPEDVVSRAWLKMEEGLRWSQLPLKEGETVAELGSAPGGASQSLLARGCKVLGIDPAAMDEKVLADPNFTHVRARSSQVPRRVYRKVRWLTADMNVAPNYTLDAVEEIVQRQDTKIRGLLLTLKLADWELADHIGDYLARIRGWGFATVRARQLQFNRQEICVTAR